MFLTLFNIILRASTYIAKIDDIICNYLFILLQTSINSFMDFIFSPAQNMKTTKPSKNNHHHKKKNKRWKLRSAYTSTILCMNATTTYHSIKPFDSDAESIGIDNRASACISHCIDDFVGIMTDTRRTIIGYHGTKTSNLKMGTLRWKWTDDQGLSHVHTIPNSFYSPEGQCRLLSPQHWAQSCQQKAQCITTATEIILEWGDGKFRKTVPLGKNDNVATMYSSPGYDKFQAFLATAEYEDDEANPIICHEATSIIEDEDVMSSNNTHIHPSPKPTKHETLDPQKQSNITSQLELQNKIANQSSELLHMHCKFGHIPFARLKIMAKQGIIPKHLAHAPTPACVACLYGRATKRQWRHRTPTNQRTTLKQATQPGERISVDMLQSPQPGFIAQMTGILTTQRYNYATVYVDNYSGFCYLHLQKSSTVAETLQGKKAFEMVANQHGVIIQSYHADNGIFRANDWIKDCHNKNQTLTFAGVNAHHQNGKAERRIRLLQELTRTQMIHLQHKWNRINTTPLWPYAMRMANDCLNQSPNMQHKSKLTAAQIFASSLVNDNPIHKQPFGSPVYVLQSPLQQNLPFQKWKHRSKLGLYLGPSPVHARNVSLVLNLNTGLVSPQFHVVHDATFKTVQNDRTQYQWSIKAGFERSASISKTTSNNIPATNKRKRATQSIPSNNMKLTKSHSSSEDANNSNTNIPSSEDATTKTQNKTTPSPEDDAMKEQNIEPPEGHHNNTNTMGRSQSQEHKPQRKSQRQRKPVEKLLMAMRAEMSPTSEGAIAGEIYCLQSMFPDHDMYEQQDSILAFKATANPDMLYYHEAMKQPDKKHFIQAMETELDENFENNNFEVVHMNQVPQDATILPSVWQLRRKRHIQTGEIKKYKARINIDGSKMIHGKHYNFTYAPVASWTTIRLILTIAAMFKWPTCQLDYVLAFPQAPIERELYMKIPKGYEVPQGKTSEHVLKLKNNLYGQKQAGRVWNRYLINKLKSIGFEQSEHDECVLYRGKVIYVLYTDDSIITAPTNALIQAAINDIKTTGLNMTDEGSIEDFLGVNITYLKDGSIHFHQPHLIDQILHDLNIQENTSTKEIPAKSSKILSRHSSSSHHDDSFNYKSIIGKLGYLEKGSRPDIAYIAHQCARFSTAPKKEHANALRWLARYLKGTRTYGMILRPDPTKGLELFVDADFAGNWDPDETDDVDTARSRHGFCVKYANCIIHWKSQLQREIALSSTESEYTGLSYAIRDTIPIINLLDELTSRHKLPHANPTLHLRVYEDNSGAIEIATNHKYRPRTKHLNNRIHHFRKYVDSGKIKIAKIASENQQADLFTKPLAVDQFEKLRKLLLNW